MARNGSGTYSLYAGNPIASGSTSNSTLFNNTLSDIATALTGSLAKDGQTVPTANLPMGGFKHTGTAIAAAQTDYARASQVQDGSIVYLTSVSGTNTITATGAISMTAYTAGMSLDFLPAATNTGATTINVNSIGAKNIFHGGAALVGSELKSGIPARILYDGTQFHLLANLACEKISAGTVSSAATLDFTGLIAAYREYRLVFDALKPATDNVPFRLRLSDDGGSTYEADASDYAWAYNWVTEAGSTGALGDDADSSIEMASNAGNQSAEEMSGEIRLLNPAGSTITQVLFRVVYQSNGPVLNVNQGAGQIQAAGATTAFRVLFGSGNIATMNYTLYGLRA